MLTAQEGSPSVVTRLPVYHETGWPTLDMLFPAGLFDNVLSDYLWVRAVLLTGTCLPIPAHFPLDNPFNLSLQYNVG